MLREQLLSLAALRFFFHHRYFSPFTMKARIDRRDEDEYHASGRHFLLTPLRPLKSQLSAAFRFITRHARRAAIAPHAIRFATPFHQTRRTMRCKARQCHALLLPSRFLDAD